MYTYMYLYAWMHGYIHVHNYEYIHGYLYAWIHTCLFICMDIYIQIGQFVRIKSGSFTGRLGRVTSNPSGPFFKLYSNKTYPIICSKDYISISIPAKKYFSLIKQFLRVFLLLKCPIYLFRYSL
jgi:hypothetical protein